MKTEIWESDPFTPKKGRLLTTLDTDYRFEKGDEFFFDAPERLKVRVMVVQLRINGATLTRDVLALKL